MIPNLGTIENPLETTKKTRGLWNSGTIVVKSNGCKHAIHRIYVRIIIVICNAILHYIREWCCGDMVCHSSRLWNRMSSNVIDHIVLIYHVKMVVRWRPLQNLCHISRIVMEHWQVIAILNMWCGAEGKKLKFSSSPVSQMTM